MIASLMHEHPSRAIVLRIRPGSELDARVFAQCWMPFGKRQQICCEQVEITSPEAALGDAASLITGIVVPDLPVVLYLRTPALIGNAGSRCRFCRWPPSWWWTLQHVGEAGAC